MEENLRDFLLSRQAVTEESLQKMESEKIDIEAIMGMTSNDLKQYIPLCGDRIATINFCRRYSTSNQCANRTMSLLEKLKRGQKLLSEEDEKQTKKLKETDTKRRSLGRKPQITRKIHLGWILNGTPVRQNRGGGSRSVIVNKSARKADLLKIAKDLFFPNGKSPHGNLENFKYDLLDFQQTPLEDSFTVGDIYEITKINILRFYLSTNEKKTKTTKTRISKYTLSSDEGEEIDYKNKSEKERFIFEDIFENRNKTLDEVDSFVLFEQLTPSSNEEKIIDIFVENAVVNMKDPVNDSNSVLDSAIPVSIDISNGDSDSNLEDNQNITLLRIHRGRVFEELLQAFQQNISPIDRIKIEMVLPNGEIEKADDQGGVFRDTLTEFWNTFYEKCTVGTKLKIPYLRHDFGEIQWNAIAKILVHGYLEQKYFPIKLAPVFIDNCLGHEIDDESLINDFKNFVSESEAEVIDEALNNFNNSNEEIMDFFITYESKWLPTAHNIKQLLRDIAHKELIQKPAFVAKSLIQEFQKTKLFNPEEIRMIYQNLKPSAKNCLAQIILQDENLNSSKKELFNFLKKFIKESDDRMRSLFLRFCTGSDLPINQIKVSFEPTSPSEFRTHPVAHTCTGLLILPLGYENYVDFRNDMNNILSSNIWIMDII